MYKVSVTHTDNGNSNCAALLTNIVINIETLKVVFYFVDCFVRTSTDAADFGRLLSVFVHIFWSRIYADVSDAQSVRFQQVRAFIFLQYNDYCSLFCLCPVLLNLFRQFSVLLTRWITSLHFFLLCLQLVFGGIT